MYKYTESETNLSRYTCIYSKIWAQQLIHYCRMLAPYQENLPLPLYAYNIIEPASKQIFHAYAHACNYVILQPYYGGWEVEV